MQLGAFSISLNVASLDASRDFYHSLGFIADDCDTDQSYLIMRNGDTILGLFENIIPHNMLTFNPGWDQNAAPCNPFDDVRTIQQRLTEAGIALDEQADPLGTGPAHITLTDPDGNAILIDQHR